MSVSYSENLFTSAACAYRLYHAVTINSNSEVFCLLLTNNDDDLNVMQDTDTWEQEGWVLNLLG